MGSCFTKSVANNSTDFAALIVYGYCRIHIKPTNSTPIDILNLCINYFKYSMCYELKDEQQVMIEHFGGYATAHVWEKLLTEPHNGKVGIFGSMDNHYSIWIMHVDIDDTSTKYVVFRSAGNWKQKLTIQDCDEFIVRPLYVQNCVKLETKSSPGQYVTITEGELTATTHNKHAEQCIFKIWPAFKKATKFMLNNG